MGFFRKIRRAAGRLLPRRVKDLLWAIWDLPATLRFRRRGFRVPPRRLRRWNPPAADFIRAGRNCAEPLVQAVRDLGRPFDEFERVLDFGCGSGRVLQHLYGRFECTFYGCDVDEAPVRWAERSFPEAVFEVNEFAPPLPFPPRFFDMVFSVSVFTHLDEEAQFDWLDEVHRVLKPGGLALLSVRGKHGLRKRLSGEAELTPTHRAALEAEKNLEEAGFTFQDYLFGNEGADSFRRRGITGKWGLAAHSEEYIRREWGRLFRVVDVRPGVVDDIQDLVLLEKPDSDAEGREGG